jgi:hypothetical protein
MHPVFVQQPAFPGIAGSPGQEFAVKVDDRDLPPAGDFQKPPVVLARE